MTKQTFTASNGVTIHLEESAMPVYSRPATGTPISPEERMQALREYFQHERDEQLGRWRDPENPDMVVYPVQADPGTVMVIDEREGVAIPCGRDTFVNAAIEIGDDHTFPISDYDRTAARYFAAHPETKPWHDAKPGEVWVLETELHPEPRAFKVSSREGYATSNFTQVYNGQPLYTFRDGAITGGRRIWPEEADDE